MVMDADHIQSALDGVDCEIRLDELTRQLYATDASIYQMTPLGVAFPKSAWQAAAVLQRAADNHISITPRGAGTGLAGGAVSDGLVVDFARHNQLIPDLNVDAKTVRVGAGGVLDQLNAFLKPNGLRFGPDVATSSRATLGGMIANDSSGSHAPLYGTTGQHVRSIEVVLADGRVATIGEDGANGFVTWLNAAADKVKINPGGMFALYDPSAAAYAVTASTGDILRITETGSSNAVTYNIILIGTV